MKKIIFLCSLVSCFNLNAAIVSVYQTKTHTELTFDQFVLEAVNSTFIVMGEFHYDQAIQKAEGQIIQDVSRQALSKSTSVMWEFLDFTEQKSIDRYYSQLSSGSITAEEFLHNTVGDKNSTYVAVMDAAVATNSKLIGLNLPRDLKQKVMKEGIESIDPSLVPSAHYLSGKNYYDRFLESMGGHVPEEKAAPYYLAQCLTDSVMAHTALVKKDDLNFIVAGSFHTDFFDGTVEKLKKWGEHKVMSVKIVNLDDLSEEEKAYITNGDEQYGSFADYIIFASEK